MTHTVDVVIPVRDGERFLSEAIASVLQQTHAALTVTVVDDGSRDRSAAIAAEHAGLDDRVEVFPTPPRGLAAARNAGLARGEAQFVAFLDADDRWLPQKLEAQLELLTRTRACVGVGCGYDEIGPEGDVRSPWVALRERFPVDVIEAVHLIEHGNLIAGSGSGVLAHRDAVAYAGGFDEDFSAAEDLDLWYRLTRFGELRVHSDRLAQIRVCSGGMQSDYVRVLRGRARFLRKVGADQGDPLAPLAAALCKPVERRLVRQLVRKWRLGEAARVSFRPFRRSGS